MPVPAAEKLPEDRAVAAGGQSEARFWIFWAFPFGQPSGGRGVLLGVSLGFPLRLPFGGPRLGIFVLGGDSGVGVRRRLGALAAELEN